jgi:hypothetical protein
VPDRGSAGEAPAAILSELGGHCLSSNSWCNSAQTSTGTGWLEIVEVAVESTFLDAITQAHPRKADTD